MRNVKRFAALWLARERQRPIARAIGSLSTSFARAYENDNADLMTNGEARVLRSLAACAIDTVFDVGAHEGSWSLEAARLLPTATIHAFEIDPDVRELLRRRMSKLAVVTPAFGLASRAGSVSLYVDDAHPQTTSLIRWSTEERREIRVRVESGDDYMRSAGLEKVDFLKVDVEGADLEVLRGFDSALSGERIGIVQFEFTAWAPISRTWLGDFYDFLTPRGFTIGKIYPTYVEWRDYDPTQEIFVRSNFVAVHRSRPELRTALSA